MPEPPRLQSCLEIAAAAPDRLTAELRAFYDGGLGFPAGAASRPHVFANFVTTIDGVASFALPGQAGGGTVSGDDAADQMLMGMLRASADAIMVGASTLHQVPAESLWLPESVFPAAAPLYREYREGKLGKKAAPLFVVVSGSGKVDLDRAIFRDGGRRALILTSPGGKEALVRANADRFPGLELRALPSTAAGLAPEAMLAMLGREFGVRQLLHEGGPTLIGEFLRAGALDELFLTVAPRLAGRAHGANPRVGLVAGAEFQPGNAPWGQLISAKTRHSFLYLRYSVGGAPTQ